MRKRWIAGAGAVMLILAGCSTNTMTELNDSKPAVTKSFHPTLKLRVETSGRNATVYIMTDLKLSKEDENMERKDGEGHIHLYLDDGEKMMLFDNKYVLTGLQPGKHTVNVSLHNNDHTPYDVADQVEFEIK